MDCRERTNRQFWTSSDPSDDGRRPMAATVATTQPWTPSIGKARWGALAASWLGWMFTTQLFFSQTLSDVITTTVSPYSSRGLPDITNASNNIYNSSTELALATATSSAGYTAAVPPGVQTG